MSGTCRSTYAKSWYPSMSQDLGQAQTIFQEPTLSSLVYLAIIKYAGYPVSPGYLDTLFHFCTWCVHDNKKREAAAMQKSIYVRSSKADEQFGETRGVHGEGVTEAGIRIRSSPGGSDTDHRAVMLTIVALLFGFAGAVMGAATFGDPDVKDNYNSVPNSTNNDTVSQKPIRRSSGCSRPDERRDASCSRYGRTGRHGRKGIDGFAFSSDALCPICTQRARGWWRENDVRGPTRWTPHIRRAEGRPPPANGVMAPKLTLVSRSLLFFHLVSLFLGSVNASFQDPDDNRTSINDLPNYTDSVKEAMITECKGGYSPNCLKLGLIRVISRSGSFSLPVLPGVSISSDGLRDSETPADEPGANLVAHPEKIDHLLLDRVSGYLGTLSLNMRVLEKNAPLSFAKSILGDGITGIPTEIVVDGIPTLRNRKKEGRVQRAALGSGADGRRYDIGHGNGSASCSSWKSVDGLAAGPYVSSNLSPQRKRRRE
ncbi:unnamed protein product [Nesidiocoris tenuis]|uniref:Uncharacterized protein n=1 Tax=Nesidiocoris tenuis TaxID=355587 RepID=A0A6H5GDL7_9HEMI|nr:unnamed protein product [Nesidiocoris tenuis]